MRRLFITLAAGHRPRRPRSIKASRIERLKEPDSLLARRIHECTSGVTHDRIAILQCNKKQKMVFLEAGSHDNFYVIVTCCRPRVAPASKDRTPFAAGRPAAGIPSSSTPALDKQTSIQWIRQGV